MSELSGLLCLGSLFLIPALCFFLGYMVGADKLPFKVRVERNRRAVAEVDDGTQWQSSRGV